LCSSCSRRAKSADVTRAPSDQSEPATAADDLGSLAAVAVSNEEGGAGVDELGPASRRPTLVISAAKMAEMVKVLDGRFADPPVDALPSITTKPGGKAPSQAARRTPRSIWRRALVASVGIGLGVGIVFAGPKGVPRIALDLSNVLTSHERSASASADHPPSSAVLSTPLEGVVSREPERGVAPIVEKPAKMDRVGELARSASGPASPSKREPTKPGRSVPSDAVNGPRRAAPMLESPGASRDTPRLAVGVPSAAVPQAPAATPLDGPDTVTRGNVSGGSTIPEFGGRD
jgi:hypothetical protein